MKKGFVLRVVAVCATLAVLLVIYNKILTPKYRYGDGFPTTDTYLGFYEESRNSIELLFLGSSHGVCGFNPEVMDGYGISSYNLSCEQQNLVTTYYWLKEALRFQNPDTVVVECGMLYLFEAENIQATVAGCTRKAIDFMKWSPVKLEAVSKLHLVSDELTMTSFLLPNTVYHSRWKELEASDFNLSATEGEAFLRGFYPLNGSGVEGYEPIADACVSEISRPNSLMLAYLDKIVDLCKTENIRLILASTPSSLEEVGQYCYIRDYAGLKGVELIDYNSCSVYEAMEYDFYTDNNDDDHANVNGAAKITKYLGEYLVK